MIILLTGPTCVGKSTYINKKKYKSHVLVIEIDHLYKKARSFSRLHSELNQILLASHASKKHIIIVGSQLMLPGVLNLLMQNIFENILKSYVLILYMRPTLKNLVYLFERIKHKKSNWLIAEKILLFFISRLIAIYIPISFFLLKKKHNNRVKIKKVPLTN